MYAAAAGNLDEMKVLIAAGADVKAKNDFDITALMWCTTDEAKVGLLIGKGADVNARSKQGRTPLLIAAASEPRPAIVKLLLDSGADLKKANADPGATPLTASCQPRMTRPQCVYCSKKGQTAVSGGRSLRSCRSRRPTATSR